MKKHTLILAVQLLFFISWYVYLLNDGGGEYLYLEAEPADPSDILSGAYLELKYGIENPEAASCASAGKSGPVYALLEQEAGRGGGRRFYKIKECAYDRPRSGLWVKAYRNSGGKGLYFRNIKRFYINEKDNSGAASGKIAAKAKIRADHNFAVVGLEKY